MSHAHPKLSVVIPLHDERGVVLDAINAWRRQRTPALAFQIIVVDSGKPHLARKIATMLEPGDRMVKVESTNEAILYNAGGKVATADWILFTESHVTPVKTAATSILRRIDKTSCDAAILGVSHANLARFALLDSEREVQEYNSLRSLGLWRAVGLRGFLIRSSVFAKIGSFNEDYLRFAETALAIHLIDAGYRLEEFPEVFGVHFDTHPLKDLIGLMSVANLGACRFWQAEPQLAAAYFGSPPPDDVQGLVDPKTARIIWRQMSLALLTGKWAACGRLLPLALPTLLTAIAGWRLERFKSLFRAYRESLYLLWLVYVTHRKKTPRQCPQLMQRYVHLRKLCMEVGGVDFRAEQQAIHNVENTSTFESTAVCTPMLGFFSPEIWQGETYCWSKPSAAITLSLNAEEQKIRLDVRPTGGWLARRPNFHLNGEHIPAENVSEIDGILEILVPADRNRTSFASILSWNCIPFIPANAGLPDQRHLGVALIRVEVRQKDQANLRASKERAA